MAGSIGFNTDAPGFRAGVELAMDRSLAGCDVVVAGAGGAAHAVVFACLDAGARRVTVANRTPGSAAALVARFAGVGTGDRAAVALADPAFEAALRVRGSRRQCHDGRDARSGGDDPGRASCPRARRSSTSSTCHPRRRCSRAARARGLRAANGSEMLIAQAAIAFERWTGVGGMADVMRTAVAPLLADATVRA